MTEENAWKSAIREKIRVPIPEKSAKNATGSSSVFEPQPQLLPLLLQQLQAQVQLQQQKKLS